MAMDMWLEKNDIRVLNEILEWRPGVIKIMKGYRRFVGQLL